MFSIFKGQWRGLGKSKTETTIWIRVGVEFRDYVHLFKGAKLHVLLILAMHMNEDGITFPSYDLLEKKTGYGRDTIASALDDLCSMQIENRPVLLRWRDRNEVGQFTGSNQYILFPTDEEIEHDGGPESTFSNGGETGLEEEPIDKEDTDTKGAVAPREVVEESLTLLADPETSVNVGGVVVHVATTLFGEKWKDYRRAGAVIKVAAGAGPRSPVAPKAYRAAALRVVEALGETEKMSPPPDDLWTYITALVKPATGISRADLAMMED